MQHKKQKMMLKRLNFLCSSGSIIFYTITGFSFQKPFLHGSELDNINVWDTFAGRVKNKLDKPFYFPSEVYLGNFTIYFICKSYKTQNRALANLEQKHEV